MLHDNTVVSELNQQQTVLPATNVFAILLEKKKIAYSIHLTKIFLILFETD